MGRTESVVDSGHGLVKSAGLHLAPDISALRSVGVVHHMRVQGGIGNQRDMMGSNVDIVTRAVIVIKGRNAVIDTTNRPVVTDVKIIESASGNSGILSGSDRRTKVFPPVDGIVRSGTGGVYLFQSGCVGLNERFQIGFEIGNGNGLHTVSVIQEKERTIGCACDNGQV